MNGYPGLLENQLGVLNVKVALGINLKGDKIMGYYTDYELAHNGDVGERARIDEYIETHENLAYAVGENEPCKWYHWKEDMVVMSQQFPKVTFVLEGHGEEYGDIWRATIKNGDIQIKKATITF